MFSSLIGDLITLNGDYYQVYIYNMDLFLGVQAYLSNFLLYFPL